MDDQTIFIGLIIVIVIQLLIIYSNKKDKDEALNKKDKELDELRKQVSNLTLKIEEKVNEKFDLFKKNELNQYRNDIKQNINAEYKNMLEFWKMENEADIRQDAINRSQAVTLGKVSEHLIPFHIYFPYNPKDARFIGSPIDMIVFDGASIEEEVNVYFLEIKTGNSTLNNRQKLIKDAILNHRVFWREVRLNDLNTPKLFNQK